MKIKVWSETGLVGGDREEIIEVDDDATADQIEEEAREWFFNYHSYGWKIVGEAA